jgi:hypothetical protein
MTETAGAGLRRGRAAWVEHERERGCAKWDGGASAGAGGAQKELGAWAGDVAEEPGERARALVHGGRGEGGADRAVPRHSERERAGARG